MGFGAYFEHVLKELGVTVPHWGWLSPAKLLAAGVTLVFAYVNFRGASETGKVGNIVTITKVAILAVFAFFGLGIVLHRPDWKVSFTPFMPNGFTGVINAMGLTFIAFQGYEVISQCSEEIQSPKKDIPRAVFLSILIVIPIYLLIGVAALGSVSPANITSWDYLAQHKEIALVQVARSFFAGGGIMILIGGLISTVSALNATIYSSSRVAFAMGRDRNFPGLFGKVHKTKFTPHWSIFISTCIIVLMAVSLPIEDVAASADVMFLLLFLQVNVTLISLRKKRPDLDRGFVTPLFPLLPIIGVASQLFLAVSMFNYSPTAWIVTAIWIVAGLAMYRGYAAKREIAHARKLRALERLERKEYGILVAVSNPARVLGLVTIAAALAKKNRAQIILLHVVEMHENEPLKAGISKADAASPLIEIARPLLEPHAVDFRPIICVSHRISQGILETAEAEGCNLILLGRQQRPTFPERVLSSVIDTVLQKSTCEVAVLHGLLPEDGIERIVIPFSQNIHTRLAIEVAPALIGHFKCPAQVLAVMEPGTAPDPREAQVRTIRGMIEMHQLPARLEIVDDKDVLQGILQYSRSQDLIVMGGRAGGFLELLFRQSLTQEITDRVNCPVLWLKEYVEPPSFWVSLFRPYTEDEERHHE